MEMRVTVVPEINTLFQNPGMGSILKCLNWEPFINHSGICVSNCI